MLFFCICRPHDPMAFRSVNLNVEELREPVPVKHISQRDAILRQNGVTNGEPYKALRDEMLSNSSVLNQRKGQVDPALSKTSVLNVRYTSQMASSTGNENGEQPDNRVNQKRYGKGGKFGSFRSEVSDSSANMDHWIDNVFNTAFDRNVDELGSPQAMERRIRGIGDNLYTTQVNLLLI